MQKRNPQNTADAYTYANMLSRMNRNPIEVIVGDLSRMVNVIANLGKNRKLAQARIEQLQDRVNRVEAYIEMVNPKTTGNRLDKLR